MLGRGCQVHRILLPHVALLSTKSVRVRQHVNPLSKKFLEPISIPQWNDIFPIELKQVHLDIGCARGHYLMQLAKIHPNKCFLGIEIRQPLVHEALTRINEQKLDNIHVIHGNMNVHMKILLDSLRKNHTIESVSIFHPDPWMKKRHIKRRLVNDIFVYELAEYLSPNTPVHLQTDVQELFEYMVEIFQQSKRYEEIGSKEVNAMGISTDREQHVYSEGGNIYRTTFQSIR